MNEVRRQTQPGEFRLWGEQEMMNIYEPTAAPRSSSTLLVYAPCTDVPKESRPAAAPLASQLQIGGQHYKNLNIQPVEYNHANGLQFIEGSIVKYITRWREKGGIQDLNKIKHFVDLLIELETKNVST